VLSVRFSPLSPHLCAVGTADGRAAIFDLRRVGGSSSALAGGGGGGGAGSGPLAVAAGHGRAVSHVRFVPPSAAAGSGAPSPSMAASSSGEWLATACTDGALRMWHVGRLSAGGRQQAGRAAGAAQTAAAAPAGAKAPASAPRDAACRMVYRGHANAKNFVGLAVGGPQAAAALGGFGGGGGGRDGGRGGGLGASAAPAAASDAASDLPPPPSVYLACGSEANQVCAYHASMPVPAARRTCAAPRWMAAPPDAAAGVAGGGAAAGGGAFVSSVAWSRRHGTLLAANSVGVVNVLELAPAARKRRGGAR
jgi:hypothetical protein